MALEKANAFRTCGITKRGADCVVWAKLDDELYWPGKIKNCAYIFKNGCDQLLVYIFGKKKCLWVKKNNIMPYLKYKTLFKRVNSMTQSLKLRGRNEEKLAAAMCDVEDYITKCGNVDVCFERPTYLTESASYVVMASECGHAVLQDATKPGHDTEVKVTPDLRIPSRLKLRECSVVLEDVFSKGPKNYARLFSLLRQNQLKCPGVLNSELYDTMTSTAYSEGLCLQPNVPENRVPSMPKSFECQPFCLQSAVSPRLLDLQRTKLEDSKNFLWQDPHMSPSLGWEISTLLQIQGFEPPSIPSSQIPNLPSSEAPDIPSSQIPNIPSSQTPNLPSFEAPNTPSSQTPNIPSSETPSIPSSEAPNIPSSQIPIRPSSQTHNLPSSEAPNIPSSQTPNILSSEARSIPSSEAPKIPSSEAPNIPSSQIPNIPSSQTPNLPSFEAPNTPSSQTPNIPSSEAPSIPSSEAPNIPSSQTPNIPSSEAPNIPNSQTPNIPSSEAPNTANSETRVLQASKTPKLQICESRKPHDSQSPTSQISQTARSSGSKNHSKRSSSTPKSSRTPRVKLQGSETPKAHSRKAPKMASPQPPKCGRRKRRKPYESPMYKLRRCSVVLRDVMKAAKNTEVQLPWKDRSPSAKNSKTENATDSHEKENLLEAMKSMFNAVEVPVKIARDAHKKIEKVKLHQTKLHSKKKKCRKNSHNRVPRRSVSSSISRTRVDDAVLTCPEMMTSDSSEDDPHEMAENGLQETNNGTENSDTEDCDGMAEKDQHKSSLEQSELGCLSAFLTLNPEFIKCEYAEDDPGSVKADENPAKNIQNGHLLDEECENRSCKLEELIDSSLTEALFSTDLIEQDGLGASLSLEPHFLQPDNSLDNFCNAQENSGVDEAMDFSDLDGLVVVKNETESNLSLAEENEENDARQYPLSNGSSNRIHQGNTKNVLDFMRSRFCDSLV